jgi:hypothetical protein
MRNITAGPTYRKMLHPVNLPALQGELDPANLFHIT